ncbi:hypothetical protein CLOP_g22949 [Closterium sp. NIES-67]|nr:hypothetical protein CLOP_g22949 [Closterium sp. NIES-67]
MHLLPETDCGPKAWAVLKDLHAPTSVAASLMLDRELSMLRLSENEPVQPVLDKMRELYAKLAIAGITYPEQTKCLKMLSLLPESWLQFISGLSLPQNQSQWTLESMWHIPALIWESTKKELGAVKAGSGVQGECNAVSAAGVTVSARSGETDWETAHRRLGHVAMPLLQQLHKEEAVKGLKLSGQPNDTKCETCLLSKFTRFPFHGVAGKSKAALELVHMDLVGPFPVQGRKGES